MFSWPNRKELFRPAHVADEDLLLFLDGEMRPWKADKVRRHLESCWSCRMRRQKIEQTISSYVEALAADEKPEPPKGWREFETRLDHFDRDTAAARSEEVQAGVRLPWRMAAAGLAIFACFAAAGWFMLARKSDVGPNGPGRIPEAPRSSTLEKTEPGVAPHDIPSVSTAANPLLPPSREEVLAKAIEIEYALHRVRACQGGAVRVTMERNGLRISGEPQSTGRNREVRSALTAVALPGWVKQDFRGAGQRPAKIQLAPAGTRMATGSSMAPPAEEAVRTFLQAHPEAAGAAAAGDRAAMAANYSSRVLSQASAAVREAWALRRLAEAYSTEAMASQLRWLLETMLRDHLRAMSGDVERAADLIAPVFGLSKATAPQATDESSWRLEAERLFGRVEEFEREASALFGEAADNTTNAPAADRAAALMSSADTILRRAEFLDRKMASVFSSAPGRTRSEGMRD